MSCRCWRAGLLAVGVACAAACGNPSSPSESAPVRVPLGDGTFLMSLLGGTTECHDVQVPQAGTAVAFRIAGSHDATGAWIGRPTSSVDGNFEIRLAVSTGPVGSNAAPLRPFDIVIRGTVTGFAIDSYAYTPTSVPSGTTANFSSTFSISGIARYPNFTFADGLGDSALVFSRNSVTATCPAGQVGWTLNGPGSF